MKFSELVDIHERTEELSRVNRAYKALSDCNQALLRATDEVELLQEVCQIIVEDCAYHLVWIGLAEHDEARTVRPVAQAGYEAGYLDTVHITWADTEQGHGPTGTAIREGNPVVNRDVLTNPDYAPWRAEALKRGYASSAALPLLAGELGAIGALNVYATQPDAFAAEEIDLLLQLAGDLAYGIMSLRARQERERAEEALRESEARYRAIVEAFDGLIYVCSQDYRVEFMNERFIERTGYDATGDLCYRALHDLDSICPWCVNERVFRGETVRWEICSPKDNRWYYIVNTPIYHADGSISKQAMIQDITERKQVEEALRLSEEKYRTMVENTNEVIFSVDTQGCITYISPAIEQVALYSLDQVMGQPFARFVHPDDLPGLQASYEKTLAGALEPYEFRVFARDGTVRHVLTSSRQLWSAGQVVGLIGVMTDITERKRAEKALQASEERFRALYDDNPSMYFTVDAAGTVLSVNQFGAAQLGYTVEELTGQSVLNVFYPDDQEAVQRQLAACLQQPGQLAHWEFRKVRKDGSVLWVREAVRVVQQADGQPVLLVVCEDITERKRAEEEKEKLQAQVVQAQKMEAIGRLAGGVAHDFNNMLTVIIGRGQFLLSKLSPDDPRARDTREILKVAERATTLTRQLLAFSRRQMLEPQVLDLNTLVADMDKMLRRLIGEDINLVAVLEADLERVQADLGQMEQVLMNLVVNARDAMPQGGNLTIKTENVDLDQEYCQMIPEARPGRFVCLSVADTGTGMEKEILERLFEPFFTTKPNGTGLGLSVVYGIVRQHEGWINVYSEPGRGSVFKVYLPALSARPPGGTERQASLPPPPGHGEWILLVEDDEQVRALTRSMLEENGYTVLAAASVKEGLDVFRQHGARIQLVFSDVLLPDGTALELVDQLLLLREDLRVVLSSGYTNERAQWPTIRERGFRFLPKPYTLVKLLRAIREVLGSPPAGSNAPPW